MATTASGHLHLLLRHSPIAAGLPSTAGGIEDEETGIEMMDAQRDLCVKDIKVEKPLHRDNPTLSSSEARFQWHEEIVTSGDFLGRSG